MTVTAFAQICSRAYCMEDSQYNVLHLIFHSSVTNEPGSISAIYLAGQVNSLCNELTLTGDHI